MYWHKKPDDITFQLTVGQLTLSSPLPKEDIHVTVCVEDLSKITCSGSISNDGLTMTWNHSFFFSAPPSAILSIAICILPEELTLEWNKQPLGNQMAINVSSLLELGNWQSNVPGFPVGFGNISIMCEIRDLLAIPDGHNCLSALQKYSTKLYNFGRWSNNVASMSTKIEVELARLDLCPLGHANHNAILDDLGTALLLRYDQDGNIADINKAVEVQKWRSHLCPKGHPEYGNALGELALVLIRQYDIQRNKEDLDKLIEMLQEWLNFCPLGHTYHATALGAFATSLQERYKIQEEISDLNKVIELREKRLELCPTGHPDHDIALHNLAESLRIRFLKLHNLMDLNRGIELQEECLVLCPIGHKDHGHELLSLAAQLLDCYNNMKNQLDLDRAIKLLKEALGIIPVHNKLFALSTTWLAEATLLSSHKPCPSESLLLVDEAFDVYKLLKRCGPAASLNLLEAVQDWVKDAEKHNHSSVLDAYQTLLSTLDLFTSLSPSLESRHGTMQLRVSNAANDAFSCATRHGDPQMAVELLEQGRGILWNQLARFNISMATLESQGNRGQRLSQKFTRLSADLKSHAQRSAGQETDPYWRVQEEWQRVVNEIRHLDGFSRFLLPPHFDDLQQATEDGPVIIVNTSKYSCDALIVLHTRAPIHVPLGCSLNDVVQLCIQLSELTQDSHAYGEHRELYVKEVLRELWWSVVERIVTVLENDVQLPPGSRIWWCPTSKFTLLPLHAAGPHRKGKKNLMDIYVSSYAPSLSALIRARDRLQSHKGTHERSGTPEVISFATVGQAHPSSETGLGHLPEVAHEIQRICDETNMPTSIRFEAVTGRAASIEGAVQAFRDHRWVHVACHGAQHAEKPFDSWFAMGDGKLTLMRIIQERYINSEFAFLSACHTAKGDASTPDEVLHLAAGMQFAGFNGVIGTLWRVDDAVAHEVVTRFYKEMFEDSKIAFEHAASALNTAVIETADDVSLEKRIVFVHIGI